MSSTVPVIDLAPWFSGDASARDAVAAEVDAALQSVGFFLITGHGVAEELRARWPGQLVAVPAPGRVRGFAHSVHQTGGRH